MSVTNSPASAILRGRRLSSRRPSGRRVSSSCDCCPSREPDEWTTWTTWGRSATGLSTRLKVGGWKTKFKRRLRVFWRQLASCANSRPRGRLYIRPPRLRGVGGADARARPSFVPRTDRVSSIDRMSIFRRCSGGFGAREKRRRRPDPRVVSTWSH